MDRTVDKAPTDQGALRELPLVVELVGPAGAGKTSLLQALCQRSESILVGCRPHVQRVEYIPFFVRNVVSLLPVLLRPDRNGRWFTGQEIAMLATLKGWHRVLMRQASGTGLVIVVDQGPVFLLSWLYEFGPTNLRNPSSEEWWDGMIKQGASVVDVIVWLDAPDAILMQRIVGRAKWHLLKGRSDPDAFALLERHRKACRHMVSKLTVGVGGPKVLSFDTARESLDTIVVKILAVLGCENEPRLETSQHRQGRKTQQACDLPRDEARP